MQVLTSVWTKGSNSCYSHTSRLGSYIIIVEGFLMAGQFVPGIFLLPGADRNMYFYVN